MIEIVQYINLNEFEFWGNACALRDNLTNDEMDIIEDNIHYIIASIPNDLIGDIRCYEPYDECVINDVFAYCQDYVVSVLGYRDYDEFLEERAK